MTNLSAASLACAPQSVRRAFLNSLSHSELEFLIHDWSFWARKDQWPPGGDWTTWLLLGGRGSGKTRAGAEWVRMEVDAGRAGQIALVGDDLSEARDVMVEGPSGLRAVGPADARPRWEASRRRLVWDSGAVARTFSASDPEGLRGPQFDLAWADELAKWREAEATWSNLQLGLRLGARPRQAVTTTPRPTALLKRLLDEPGTITARSRTADNMAHLAPTFLGEVVSRYENTRLGRQELDGELLEDRPGALWTLSALDAQRVGIMPSLERVTVGVDPPASTGPDADACGIVVAGRSGEKAFVLADATVQGATPLGWAQRVCAAAAAHTADRIVVEVNQGGAMAEAVLAQADPPCPVRPVRASASKLARAAPIAALYEQGRVYHGGLFRALEDEMAAFGSDDAPAHSPDRVDALVWALGDLMLSRAGAPSLRRL